MNKLDVDDYWLWFCNIRGVGRRSRERLLNIFQTPEIVFFCDEEELRQLSFLSNNQVESILNKDIAKLSRMRKHLLDKEIRFIHQKSEDYPMQLSHIPDQPHGLYFKGNCYLSNKKSVAIIGARECSEYGYSTAYKIGYELGLNEIPIVSGLARGIDSAAQLGCINSGGITYGVLGCGVDICYPKENYNIYHDIQKYGAIISEYCPGTKPLAGLFPERNRIISGLSDIIIVIEAGQKSGSLITVDAALEQGKDVFVVPGRINDCKSRGCNQLIKNGAYLFENIYDIFDVLKVSHSVDDGASQKKNYYLATKEKIVYAKLSLEPKHINCLAQETGLPVATIIRIVMNLEMKHIIRQTAHNYYVVNV